MKVALLLFGQPRCVENLKVFNSHLEHIINKYSTDVFCHAWYEPNLIFKPSSWSKLQDIKCDDSAINIINEKYKPKIFEFDKPITFLINDNYLNSPRIKKYDHYLNSLNVSNIISQLYSINKVSKLFEEYCKINKEKYNFVILARYDLIIFDFPLLYNLDENFFYRMNHHPHFPDLFFIFNQKFIQTQYTYQNIELILNKIVNNEIPDVNFWDMSPECLKYNNYLLYFPDSLIRGVNIIEKRNT